MGHLSSKLYSVFDGIMSNNNAEPARILMLGLDNAGKTTILYQIKCKQAVDSLPTIGFNVETVQPAKGVSFTVWDVGGQEKIRELWKFCYQDTDGLVYVVDCSDRVRFPEARSELFHILSHQEMDRVPLVVIANKNDLPGAARVDEMIDALSLTEIKQREWHVQSACAISGDGVYESMGCMAKLVKDFKKRAKEKQKAALQQAKVTSNEKS